MLCTEYAASVATTNSRHSANDHSEVAVKLPAINVPLFDGSYSKWISFRDTYKTLVEDNKHLTTVQKFHYFKSCLTKDASRVIESLSVSKANCQSACETLF